MLPKQFKDRMSALLGDEAQALFFAIEQGEAVKAFRVNGVKVDGASDGGLESLEASVDRTPMELLKNAYYTREKYPGSLPEHHAGAIYMQDPSAMATVAAITVKRGMKVLDTCAAPGGKTGQLAALVGDEGVVVANEYEASRAKILQSNIERLGCRNTIILNVDTSTFRELYKNEFDVVLCDAPCSGEGMFRKNELAISEWSPENVMMCAERQREILGNVVGCVKIGGILLYSTCTFSLEENEYNVCWLLDTYPELELVDACDALKKATADGITYEGCPYDMSKARRFYPHISAGEGQFIAVFRKRDAVEFADDLALMCPESEAKKPSKKAEKASKNGKKENTKLNIKQAVELVELGKRFLSENLGYIPEGEFSVMQDKLWLAPVVKLPSFGVVACGVCVGEAQKGRFVPHHQLFSAFGHAFLRKLCLPFKSELARKYLFGEELDVGGISAVFERSCAIDPLSESYACPCGEENGWSAVMLGGCAVGGGKVSGCNTANGVVSCGVLKNHYPKGLRNKRIG